MAVNPLLYWITKHKDLFVKNFFYLSITSFVFLTVLWVLWHFLDSHVVFFQGKGTLFYLPHAARVLCIVYFGYRAIPAIYLGELVGPYVLNPDLYSFSTFLPSFISVMSVPFALILLNTLGLTLGETRSSPLNRRNYKHIFLITFISAHTIWCSSRFLLIRKMNYAKRI